MPEGSECPFIKVKEVEEEGNAVYECDLCQRGW